MTNPARARPAGSLSSFSRDRPFRPVRATPDVRSGQLLHGGLRNRVKPGGEPLE
jgi:hypothetical protein